VKKIQYAIKNIFDFLFSFLGLLALSPLILFVSILIKIDSKGPVIFKQKRVGRNGKIFTMYKFRTMQEGTEKSGLGYETSKDDPRVTRVGKVIRRIGFDEIPQFVNVLFDGLSLVGPRPALPHQVLKYRESEKKRLSVKQGITNMDVLKGGNNLSWEKRIEWDIWYIENWSLWLDFKILFLTPFMIMLTNLQYDKEGVSRDYK
jgi:lipopolysaccharide/colanic/teichoic acid biosynthesis glycosyltransferase